MVSRLCKPIDELDDRSLAVSLGLDGTKYKARHTQAISRSADPVSRRFQDCESLKLVLEGQSFSFCGVRAIVDGRIGAQAAFRPLNCADLSLQLTPGQIANQATMHARRCISQYYDGHCKSDEESSTRVPHYAEDLSKWTRIITDRHLYLQLTFLVKQLDVEAAMSTINAPVSKQECEQVKQHLQPALEAVQELRNATDYGTLNFQTLFRQT